MNSLGTNFNMTSAAAAHVAPKRVLENGPLDPEETVSLSGATAAPEPPAATIEFKPVNATPGPGYHGVIYDLHDLEGGYTTTHMRVAGEYALRLADALDGTAHQLTAKQKTDLRNAAKVYDAGKLVIDDSILMKPGAPTPEERAQIDRHVMVRTARSSSYDARVEEIFTSVLPPRSNGEREIIRHHHERWDGKGYPDKLAGHAIPIGAQLMGIADVFDAFTTRRPFREAMDYPTACNKMEGMAQGGMFNPELVQLFFAKVVPNAEALTAMQPVRDKAAADARTCSDMAPLSLTEGPWRDPPRPDRSAVSSLPVRNTQ